MSRSTSSIPTDCGSQSRAPNDNRFMVRKTLAMLPSQNSSTPRLLVVGNFLSHSGKTRGVCEDLAERFSSSGWPVITTSQQTGRLRRLTDMLFTVLSRRRDYDVVQMDVFSGPAFVWAEAVLGVLRRLRKPAVLTLHGGDLPAFSARWPRRVRRFLSAASRVTVPSRYLLEQMRGYWNDLILLPNPISLDACPFRLRDHPAPKLVWLRGFHENYNPCLAVIVVAKLVRLFPETSLIMIGADRGDGSLQRVREAVAASGFEGRVSFPGGVPKVEVGRWLNQGDIFLNTTHYDNAPISVLEAMACGLCVISTNVGGIPYLLTHEQDALLVPADDASSMADAVQRTLNDVSLAARLSGTARAHAERSDWTAVLPQWTSLLRGLASVTTSR